MIVAAGLLVLLGLGMFVAGLATGEVPFFWGCVGVCVVAAVLLVFARRRLGAARRAGAPDDEQAMPVDEVVAAAGAEPRTAPQPAVGTGSGRHGAAEEPPTQERQDTRLDGGDGATRMSSVAPAAGEGAHAAPHTAPHTAPPSAPAGRPVRAGEPPLEDVEVTDLLLVVDLTDEVLVVDEHPRYHLPGCRYLAGREQIPLPLDEARTDGFTPCGVCSPDRNLAERVRARKHGQHH